MQKASLVLSEQREAWRLIVEPWMLEFDIPAEVPVRLEADGLEELTCLEWEVLAQQDTITVWTYTHSFCVRIGTDEEQFDFSAIADAIDRGGPDQST